MEKFSIEQKAKRYDEAIKRLEDIMNGKSQKTFMFTQGLFDYIFPELKESKDEKMIQYFKDLAPFDKAEELYEKYGFSHKDAIEWLEKKGEKKHQYNSRPRYVGEGELLGKKAVKIEPKFKVGDWVVSPNGVYWHIDAIQNSRYQVSSDLGNCAEWPLNTNIYHKFTIQDAKDGDVLCCESGWTCIFKALDNHTNTFSSYCFMDSDKWFCNTGSECHTLNKEFMKAYHREIKPATKEQRDLLFQKIKEAGYEWDAEKKEVKKLRGGIMYDCNRNLW